MGWFALGLRRESVGVTVLMRRVLRGLLDWVLRDKSCGCDEFGLPREKALLQTFVRLLRRSSNRTNTRILGSAFGGMNTRTENGFDAICCVGKNWDEGWSHGFKVELSLTCVNNRTRTHSRAASHYSENLTNSDNSSGITP